MYFNSLKCRVSADHQTNDYGRRMQFSFAKTSAGIMHCIIIYSFIVALLSPITGNIVQREQSQNSGVNRCGWSHVKKYITVGLNGGTKFIPFIPPFRPNIFFELGNVSLYVWSAETRHFKLLKYIQFFVKNELWRHDVRNNVNSVFANDKYVTVAVDANASVRGSSMEYGIRLTRCS